jgi:serine protease Do
MRGWKTLAAVGLVLIIGVGAVGVGAIVVLAQPSGQSGSYPRRPAGAQPQSEQRFEILAPWGGSTTARRLGVTLKELAPGDAKERQLPIHSGVLVETVQPGSPAEKAGIKVGDVFLKINGEFVRSIAQVRRLVNETAVAQQAIVTVYRDGKQLDVSVTPEPASPTQDLLPDDLRRTFDDFRNELPDWLDQSGRAQPRLFQEPFSNPDPRDPWYRGRPFDMSPGASRLGIVVQELGPQLAEYFKVKAGVLVTSVTPGSPAATGGLKAGDVITAVDGKDMKTPADVAQAVRSLPDGAAVALSVTRSGQPTTVKMKVGWRRGTWHV